MFEFEKLKSEDIPHIDLYMDQVITILEQMMGSYKNDQDEKIMTKAMVNNYVKSNLISKPVKKKYNSDQMMHLIMIYHFKSILTLVELETFFTNSLINHDNSFESLYQDFIEIHGEVVEETQNKMIMLNRKNEEQRMQELMKMVITADLNKRAAEHMLKDIKTQSKE